MFRNGSPFRLGARAKACSALLVIFASLLPAQISHAALGAPEIRTPGENSLHPSAAPFKVRISGTSAPGATVSITEGLGEIAAPIANDAGNWKVDVPMSNGDHTIAAIASKDGETSLPSSTVSFAVDAVKPAVTISSPRTNAYAFAPGELLAFSGTATDGGGIFAVRTRYYRLNTLALERLAECTDCNTSSATWTDKPTLQPGYYVMTATAIDKAGNQSDAGSRTFTTALENAPSLALPTVPAVPGAPDTPLPISPTPGQILPGAEKPIEFAGRGEPNSEIEAFETKAGLGPLGSVDSDNRGRWRLKVVLPTGSYSVVFRAVDEDGNPSPWTSLLPFRVDANRPAISILTGNNTLFLPLQPVVLQGQTTDNRGVRQIIVEYWLGEEMVDRNVASCTGCPRRDVSWSDSPDLSGPGYYYAVVKAVDTTGNKSFVQSLHFLYVV